MTNPTLKSTAPTMESASTYEEIRTVEVELPNGVLEFVDDPYSDRIRCDHPTVAEAHGLGDALIEAASDLGRGRIVALVDSRLTGEMESAGFEVEAIMPGFYGGERDCAVVGTSDSDQRMNLADAEMVRITNEVLEAKRGTPGLHVAVETELATLNDVGEIAELLDDTFMEYPTPSGDPEYVAKQIEDGNMFRVVRHDGEIVACASADLIRDARTAELTDCATKPEHRGNGYMRGILHHLMDDLVEMDYPTAFTLARARVPGVNVAFQRCGFKLRGRMAKSCRIGTGLEDMNVWSRAL